MIKEEEIETLNRIGEEEFRRLVEFTKQFHERHPELVVEYEERKLFWEIVDATLDQQVTEGKLSKEEARSIKAGITAAKEVLGTRDSLTDLLTRGAWQERFGEAISYSERNRVPLSVVGADLDDLKEINDKQGHGAGDKALVLVSIAIRRAIRREDFAGRIGGDEFMVGCVDCDLEGAKNTAERIRGALTGGTKVSMGVGQMESQETAVEFIDRIDRAMYKAKKQKVVGASQIVISYPKRVSK